MTNVETADKRQAGRRQGQEWQRRVGKKEGKKRCLFFKARKWNLLAENWIDMVETVTDVVCAGAWSTSTRLRHTRWQTHVVHAAERGVFWTPKRKNLEKMGSKNDMKLISHPINVTDDTQHNIPACRDPRGPWEMNICPVDLSHLIQS